MWRWLATAGGLGVLGAVEQADCNGTHHDLQPRERDMSTFSRMARADHEGLHAKRSNHQEVLIDKVQNCCVAGLQGDMCSGRSLAQNG